MSSSSQVHESWYQAQMFLKHGCLDLTSSKTTWNGPLRLVRTHMHWTFLTWNINVPRQTAHVWQFGAHLSLAIRNIPPEESFKTAFLPSKSSSWGEVWGRLHYVPTLATVAFLPRSVNKLNFGEYSRNPKGQFDWHCWLAEEHMALYKLQSWILLQNIGYFLTQKGEQNFCFLTFLKVTDLSSWNR